MNLKLLFLIVSLITAMGCVGNLNAGPFSKPQASAKPQSPVMVSIQPTKETSAGENIDFIVSATSQIDAAQFSIIVTPPKDMQLIQGDLTWRGPIQRGQTKTLRFIGAFNTQIKQHIIVKALIQNESGPRFSASASYVVTPPKPNVRALSETQTETRDNGHATQRGDRTVIEYPLSP